MNRFRKFYYRHRERIFTVIILSTPLILLFDAMNKGWGLGSRHGGPTFLFSDLIPSSTPIGLLIFEALPVIVSVDLVYLVVRTAPYIARYVEIKALMKKRCTLKVEAEIAHVEEKKLNPLDTQYTLKLTYSVNGNFYIKDIRILNTQLARTGAKVSLLCDANDPARCTVTRDSKVTRQFDEMFGVKGRIINIIAEGAFVVIFIALIAIGV